ncbi:hypothetical protein L1987_57900 [Smallanthus sonchifolius]|uniref:Uncharacterized protein n=1 Tax=Smallanthus sonchifolius TaxID=185202 RepID=A0ACB9DET6_9ASTR|nr:hypothetical protein L1987_57900 [Smallanthus sonchifolius]
MARPLSHQHIQSVFHRSTKYSQCFNPLEKPGITLDTIKLGGITGIEVLEGALGRVGTTITTTTIVVCLSKLGYKLSEEGSNFIVGVGITAGRHVIEEDNKRKKNFDIDKDETNICHVMKHVK